MFPECTVKRVKVALFRIDGEDPHEVLVPFNSSFRSGAASSTKLMSTGQFLDDKFVCNSRSAGGEKDRMMIGIAVGENSEDDTKMRILGEQIERINKKLIQIQT